MPAWLTAVLGLLEEAPAIEKDVADEVKNVKNLLTNTSEGQQIGAFFGKFFHHTTTPGAAVVLEPKKAPAK